MSMQLLVILLAACALAWTAGCGSSRGDAPKVTYRGDSGPNKVPDEGPWKESQIALPPYPRDQDLIRFELTGQTTNRFYIDGPSLTVDPDKVVRFALVIKSLDQASTATYAGVNCTTGEWKEYAYGRDGQRWEAIKEPEWRAIHDQRINNYQHTLATEFLCTGGAFRSGPAGSAKLIVRNLKNPPPADPRAPSHYN
jgi:hypothetical protein